MIELEEDAAFPFRFDEDNGKFTQYTGMSLRDWFAGQALSAILGRQRRRLDFR